MRYQDKVGPGRYARTDLVTGERWYQLLNEQWAAEAHIDRPNVTIHMYRSAHPLAAYDHRGAYPAHLSAEAPDTDVWAYLEQAVTDAAAS